MNAIPESHRTSSGKKSISNHETFCRRQFCSFNWGHADTDMTEQRTMIWPDVDEMMTWIGNGVGRTIENVRSGNSLENCFYFRCMCREYLRHLEKWKQVQESILEYAKFIQRAQGRTAGAEWGLLGSEIGSFYKLFRWLVLHRTWEILCKDPRAYRLC